VWVLDEESRTKDGDAYDMMFETSENDFSFADPDLAGRTKNGEFIEVVADLVTQMSLNVIPIWDGLESDPIVMQFGGTLTALGSFTLGVDSLAASGIATVRKRLTGQGRRLKLKIYNNASGEEVRLSELRVGFTVADERTRMS
jgi:hypothetical protein